MHFFISSYSQIVTIVSTLLVLFIIGGVSLIILFFPKSCFEFLIAKRVNSEDVFEGSRWRLLRFKDPGEGHMTLVLERIMVPLEYEQVIYCRLTKIPGYRSSVRAAWEQADGEIYVTFNSSGELDWYDPSNKYRHNVKYHLDALRFKTGEVRCVGPESLV